jgi:predicted permease
MPGFLRDLRYAVRMLAKAPGFAAVAVITLGLGIGANTSIFSVFNALLLHPQGVLHPESVAAIRARYEKLNLKNIVISAPDFAFVRDKKDVFAASAISMQSSFNYVEGEWPETLQGASVSSQWFAVFEARPMLGRVFTPEEDQPKANHEVVLSYRAWKSTFGADPAIVERNIRLNRESYKVIGVMGPEFEWPSATDLWTPLGLSSADFAVDNIFNENYLCIARLQPGLRISNASAYLALLTQQIWDDPRTKGYPKSSGWAIFAVPFTEFLYGDVQTPLLILLGAVAFVLLIACANVAGLLLARSTGRLQEFAVRTSLGASPWRLVRQTLTESLVLALAGTALGLLLAVWGIHALLALSPENISTGVVASVDRYVLAFTLLMALLSAVIFGVAPAWQIATTDTQQNLREGRGAGSATRGSHRFRNALVVAELALALVLLAGSGVFLKSLANLHYVDIGFRPHGLMSAALALPDRQYDSPAKQSVFLRDVLELLASAPGVESAAAAVPIPFSGFGGSASFNIEGRILQPGDPGPHGDIRQVSPRYFEAMGIPLLHGRVFTDQDRLDAQPVVVIDKNLAELYWPNEDPVGKRMRNGNNSPWATIVGIVAPVRHSQVVGEESSSMGVEGAGKGVYYYSLYQIPANALFLLARSSGDAALLGPQIRQAVRAVDPGQSVTSLKTMDQRVALSLGPRRSVFALLTVFAVMALSLAAVGLFGLVRYSVAQRTQEIGIRMALGASSRDVLNMVLRSGFRLALAGVGGGLLVALATTRVMTSLLYGVSATDPAIFAGMAVLMTLVALLASWLPARRASRVDPMRALRYE